MAGLYIHVPFCQSRCIYCDFYSTTHGLEWKRRYVDALEREMTARQGEWNVPVSETLYLGGGTPSQLPSGLLQQLFNVVTSLFHLSHDAEITIEANPDDITTEWLDGLRQTPVNRISLGVQTFDDSLLRLLCRRHDSFQALRAIGLCREYGYDNLSIDLIYGLPGQTLQIWENDLKTAFGLPVTHLSAYALSFEPGTRLARLLETGLVHEADEELSLRMYEMLRKTARENGFEHYEISNFCRPGFRSRHNSSYWNQSAYLGFGPGAHSYNGKRSRRWNDPDLAGYVASQGDVPHHGEILTDEEMYDEKVMTRLRTREGLNLRELTPENREYCLSQARRHLVSGKLMEQDMNLRLTASGLFVSNDIICDLMH